MRKTRKHIYLEDRDVMESNLIFPDESYAINGAAMEVYKVLGSGFLEAVYQEALEMEFRRRGIPFVAQMPLRLMYKGQAMKQTYKPDFVCYDQIIVEIEALASLGTDHRAQVTNYLKATGYKLGLLYNFGHHPLLEKIRIANSRT